MLVLSRKPDESIKIGDSIELKVIEVKGDTVRLGIQAPTSIEILRGELVDSVSESNTEAITVDVSIFNQLTNNE